MKDVIIVLHAQDVKKAWRKVANRPFTWFYLGQDMKQRENISRLLGEERRYLIGTLLQETALKEKQPFLDFIANLGLHQQNRHHWWASDVAYKCPLINDFFRLWCYAAVFNQLCSQKKPDSHEFLIFVEDRWLYRYLWQQHRKDGSNLEFPSRIAIIPEILILIAKGFFYRGYFLTRVGRQILRKRELSGNHKTSSLYQDQENVYIYTWIRDRFFKENGEFESPYFGRLPQLLSDHGFHVTYIAELFLTPALSRRCLAQGKDRFIFLDQYIDFWSMVRRSLSLFRINAYKVSPLRTLLLREIAYGFLSSPGRTLEYFAFKRWLKNIKQERITIIYLFENQPWEKLLCLAARESGKNIKLIGYQHSIVPPLLLNYFLGAGEASIMPLPSLIVANGEHTRNLLSNAGYGDTEIVNGGALRYGYMHEIAKGSAGKDENGKTVLVALSYSRNLTEELLISLFNVFQDYTGKDVRFVLKFHPEAPPESLSIRQPDWPAHFEKTDRNMEDILKEVDLVIYSSTTVGLEALVNGVPVIRYYSEHSIDLDPLNAFDERAVKSCSESSLKQVVLSALSEGADPTTKELASEANNLNKFFSPVNEDLWVQIVKN
jgi:hypothetical protein